MDRKQLSRLCIGIAAASLMLPFASAYSAPEGWDYNLTKKCARGINSSDPNYYEENAQCTSSDRNWAIVVQSEKDFDQVDTCTGNTNHSFPVDKLGISDPNDGSPVGIEWGSPNPTNWPVRLRVDTKTTVHPCGSGYFTFLSFKDDVLNHGGPLPDPRVMWSSHTVYYTQQVGTSADDWARLVVGAQVFYGGSAHLIEIHLASANWGDEVGTPTDAIVNYVDNRVDENGQPTNHPNPREYAQLYGPAWGLYVTPGQAKSLVINWGGILNQLIATGLFDSLSTQDPAATGEVYMAVETRNMAIADLWHTDFRVASQ